WRTADRSHILTCGLWTFASARSCEGPWVVSDLVASRATALQSMTIAEKTRASSSGLRKVWTLRFSTRSTAVKLRTILTGHGIRSSRAQFRSVAHGTSQATRSPNRDCKQRRPKAGCETTLGLSLCQAEGVARQPT